MNRLHYDADQLRARFERATAISRGLDPGQLHRAEVRPSSSRRPVDFESPDGGKGGLTHGNSAKGAIYRTGNRLRDQAAATLDALETGDRLVYEYAPGGLRPRRPAPAGNPLPQLARRGRRDGGRRPERLACRRGGLTMHRDPRKLRRPWRSEESHKAPVLPLVEVEPMASEEELEQILAKLPPMASWVLFAAVAGGGR
jgi:hypothetical protein